MLLSEKVRSYVDIIKENFIIRIVTIFSNTRIRIRIYEKMCAKSLS